MQSAKKTTSSIKKREKKGAAEVRERERVRWFEAGRSVEAEAKTGAAAGWPRRRGKGEGKVEQAKRG